MSSMTDAREYIRHLDLQAHPEGGWYREIYRAEGTIPAEALPEAFAGPRPFSTAIYFLLTSDNFSALHRLRSDEMWHFYAGSGLTVHVIEGQGDYRAIRLGADPARNESFQAVVPAGCWFGATVDEPESFALVGCTVAPGFDFADFEMGARSDLIRRYPAHRTLIGRLTRG